MKLFNEVVKKIKVKQFYQKIIILHENSNIIIFISQNSYTFECCNQIIQNTNPQYF